MKTLFIATVMSLVGLETVRAEQVYEAEKASLQGGTNVAKSHAGFTGNGFVGGFYQNGKGTATFQVKAAKEGKETLTFRYSAGHGDATVVLKINGKRQKLVFPSTGDWKTWKTFRHVVSLKSGKNSISLRMKEASHKAINLDSLKVGFSSITPKKVYEAENVTLSGGATVDKGHAGFSGKGFVGGFYNNAKARAEFTIPSKKAGKETVTFRYSAGHGDAAVVMTLNGKKHKLTLPTTHSWKKWGEFSHNYTLAAGDNKIIVQMASKSSKSVNLDSIIIGAVPAKKKIVAGKENVKNTSELLKKAGVDSMVLIARNFIGSSHNYTYFNEGFRPGGGLYTHTNNTFKQLIDAKQGQILDAELSYDAKQILFSWKKKRTTNYDLFVINLDGTNLRQITNHPGNDFNGSWLPDGGIAFLSDRDNNYAYCMHSSSAVLYRMQPDGSQLKRLSANYLSDIAPHVMADGKILYCRWEYVDRFQVPSQGLWAQNPDGTNLKHVYGGRMLDPVTISEAKSIPGTNKIIATLTGHNGAICGGIGVIDPSKGANNIEGLTEILGEMVRMKGQGKRKPNQKYEFPYPINEKYFLVSNDGHIELSTYDGKDVVKLLGRDQGPAKGEIGFYAALPVQTRTREPIIPSSLPEKAVDTAKIIMQDVYMGMEKELSDGSLKRGDITQIRVVEGLGKTNKGSQGKRAFCFQFPVVSGGATMEPKKTVSVVTVEKDGSAMFEVPAMKPLIFQALDKNGKVIQRMRTFSQFMPGEVQSCTGCHADRNTVTPSNKLNRIVALQKPIQTMNGAPWKEHVSAFSYPHQVQPIWDKNCTTCHNAINQPGGLDLSGDLTDLFNVSYDNLVRDGINQNPQSSWSKPHNFPHKFISYIPSYNGSAVKYMAPEFFKPKSWGSYKSKLTEVIDSGHPNSKGEARIKISDSEKRIIYAWMDYNVPYYPTSHTNHPDLGHGMRELVPHQFDKLLLDVAERRCISCHDTQIDQIGWWGWNLPHRWKKQKEWKAARALYKLPRKFYLRWEKPELNNFMLAPLAKSAGGTEMCGKAVFADKNDADYQKLLNAFKPIHKRISKIPRMDMPGAKESRGKYHSVLYKCQEQP